jgi:hypothetical protein
VEELIRIPRSADVSPATEEFPQYQEKRKEPVETTIWQIEADITALKLEADGDYHLVLQGTSGETMIGEIPTPHPPLCRLRARSRPISPRPGRRWTTSL